MSLRKAAVDSRLKYWTLCAALLLVACIQTSSGLPQPAFGEQENQNSYVISETVNLVELPVTVRDSKGQFVSGLEQIGDQNSTQLNFHHANISHDLVSLE